MLLGIDPKIDFAFKYLYGRNSTRDILIDAVNSVLQPPPGHAVVEIELLNPFNLQESFDDKLSVLDIKARDQSGRLFNIEMQILAYLFYDKRILYYWSELYGQQLGRGQDYGLLRPTISISFLNHVMFPEAPDYHLRFQLLERQHHFAMSEDIEFHILQLPKFTRKLSELTSPLDAWLYFLRFAEKIDTAALPAELRQPSIVRAVEELTMLTQNDIERERYESRRKAQMDQISAINAARLQGQEKAELIGREKGEQIGVIHLCQSLLNQPITPKEKLLGASSEELIRLADELRKQVMKR
jgi:predicted transposase/invertase (TIGR01784 family)